MPLTLGLDLSITNTGVVVLDDGDVVYRSLFGTESDEGEWGYRLHVVYTGVLRAMAEFPLIERVGIEDYARGKKNRREEMGEVTGQIKRLLWQHDLVYLTVAPQELKKWALGVAVNGDKGKQMMLRAAREEGLRTFDHNVADAFWVARWTDDVWDERVE